MTRIFWLDDTDFWNADDTDDTDNTDLGSIVLVDGHAERFLRKSAVHLRILWEINLCKICANKSV